MSHSFSWRPVSPVPILLIQRASLIITLVYIYSHICTYYNFVFNCRLISKIMYNPRMKELLLYIFHKYFSNIFPLFWLAKKQYTQSFRCLENLVKYSLFHKTLPKSSFLMHLILVKFYEMGNTQNIFEFELSPKFGE